MTKNPEKSDFKICQFLKDVVAKNVKDVQQGKDSLSARLYRRNKSNLCRKKHQIWTKIDKNTEIQLFRNFKQFLCTSRET